MEGSIVVTKNEQFNYRLLEEFRAGRLSKKEVAKLLGVSEKTVQRRAKKIREKGLVGIKHGNCQRRPHNQKDPLLKSIMLGLVAERYYDFNMTHCLEMLEKNHGLRTSYATFHKWCRSAGLGKRKRRRASKARVYRERMANAGLLLQMDGSHHKWNGRDDWVLIAMIDDATSDIPYGEFFTSEDTWNCLTVLRRVIEIRGIPEAVYVDKAGWFGGLKRQYFSQFVRVCDELGIKVIYANSPEAKGRIERAWQTCQDRLIPELRLQGITTMEAANQYLHHSFLTDYWSQRNTVEARSSESRFRPLPAGLCLDDVFCMKHDRQVRSDHTVQINSSLYKIGGGFVGSLRGKTIVVCERQNGDLSAYYGHLRLSLTKINPPSRRWSNRSYRRVS